MKHIHRMPYGAELTANGCVRFRLWAPGAKRVQVVLDRPLDMQPVEGGWYELSTDAAQAGSPYRYRIDGKLEVPDPASRYNSGDVHGPSVVIDPLAFQWMDDGWTGRPWDEAVVYELHVGTFTPEGTFAALAGKLDYLAELGVTMIELMPIADFPGKRGWGYDGVLTYAPESAYGTPNDLKSLIAAAHARNLGMMLDVVYNHFGPEGNYLHAYAPQFFTDRHRTPWGDAINFDGPDSRPVRDFFIHNALYWLEEYRFDGLRVDAVHAIADDSPRHFIDELMERVSQGPGRERAIHIALENHNNQTRWPATAQWNDDFHHCAHVILTGEHDGYYVDYAENPHALWCRSLAEGYAYQGEMSQHQGHARGEPSAHLPVTAFVNFLQNHDQIGNRALGERLAHLVPDEAALLAATAILLLSPAPPMLFMGEEWAAAQPFLYFCDFEPTLAGKVREGRKREFARFAKFQDHAAGNRIPDPTVAATFDASKLDWSQLTETKHARWLDHYRRLLTIRQRDIVPLIPQIRARSCAKLQDNGAFSVNWQLADRSKLHLIANLAAQPSPLVQQLAGRVLFATHPNIRGAIQRNELEPWSVTWLYERPLERRAVDRSRVDRE